MSKPPLLYPEYSHELVDRMYHDLLAAIQVAAEQSLGRGFKGEQVAQRVREFVDAGAERSEKSAVIRRLRNMKGTTP